MLQLEQLANDKDDLSSPHAGSKEDHEAALY